jgi:hypothetical protein
MLGAYIIGNNVDEMVMGVELQASRGGVCSEGCSALTLLSLGKWRLKDDVVGSCLGWN